MPSSQDRNSPRPHHQPQVTKTNRVAGESPAHQLGPQGIFLWAHSENTCLTFLAKYLGTLRAIALPSWGKAFSCREKVGRRVPCSGPTTLIITHTQDPPCTRCPLFSIIIYIVKGWIVPPQNTDILYSWMWVYLEMGSLQIQLRCKLRWGHTAGGQAFTPGWRCPDEGEDRHPRGKAMRHRGKEWNDASPSRGWPATTKRWKARKGDPRQGSESISLPTSSFRTSSLRTGTTNFYCFKHPQFVALCYSSPRKQRQDCLIF